jgi:hypothetical protein
MQYYSNLPALPMAPLQHEQVIEEMRDLEEYINSHKKLQDQSIYQGNLIAAEYHETQVEYQSGEYLKLASILLNLL